MANLSNINNKFLFTDGDFLKIGNLAPINNISGTESGLSITNSNVASIALDNTAANGKTYVMYSDDGGKLNFYDVDASSGRLVIDSSGNVGIGDASPDSTLSLQNSQSTAANNTTTGSIFQALSPNSGIFMRNRGASAGIGGSSYSTQLFTDSGAGNFEIYNISSTFSLVFGTNATERMKIDSAGNVGINETSPSSYFSPDLVVKAKADLGGITIRSNATSHNNYLMFADSTSGNAAYRGYVNYNHSADSMTFGSAAVARMTIDSSGDVSIKTGYLSIDSVANNSASVAGQYRLALGHDASTDASWIQSNGVSGTQRKLLLNPLGGNVGIGITSPNTTLHVDAGQNSGNLTNNVAVYIGGGFVNNDLYHREGGLLVISGTNATQTSAGIAFQTRNTGNTNYWKSSILMNRGGELEFYTGGAGTGQGSERMKITSSGTFLVNQTTPSTTSDGFGVWPTGSGGGNLVSCYNGTGNTALILGHGAYDGTLVDFRRGSTQVGTISVSTSATQYNTSSDYRLKENVVSMTGALDRVSQLKPSRFNFIADADKTVDGFLAHEVQEIVPEAITGEKDAVDEEGNPDYQGIDQSKLVPLLVGAIQELKAEIDELKK
jgi:hypothetical protein